MMMDSNSRAKKEDANSNKRFFIEIRALRHPEMWSVLIAALALLLSQLPPVLSVLKGTSVTISSIDTITLATENFGNPVVLAHIGAENNGGRNTTIQQFSCTLAHRDSGNVWQLPVYVSELPGESPFSTSRFSPLGWISLDVGDVWSSIIRCGSSPTEEQLREDSEIQQEFNDYIEERLNRQVVLDPRPVQVAQDLIDRARTHFESRFSLIEGNYDLTITATLRGADSSSVTGQFYLTSFAIEQLLKTMDDYKYGSGIIYPSQKGTTTVLLVDE